MADEPRQDLITTVALLSSQMGELKHALDGTLRDHGKRISVLEEKEIRRQEREKVLREEHQQQSSVASSEVTFRFSRWQLWFAAIGAMAMVASVAVAVAQNL